MNTQRKSLNKFKTVLKELSPAYAIAFAFCFMLFVYEPMMLYATQQLNFWFDFPLMVRPILLSFILFVFGSIVIFTVLFFIVRLFAREKVSAIFGIMELTVFGLLFITFLQGNVFSMNLPALDGAEIDWKSLQVNDIFTAISAIGVCGVLVLFAVKLGIKRILKYSKIFSIGFCVFLLLIAIIVMICNKGFRRKDSIITTDKNFSTVSTDKNFVIFLCDAVGSVEFKNVLEENPQYKEVFEDFTYCPDTLGGYPCTRDNIPLILGGQLNKNEKRFEDFYAETLNSSPLFKELDKKGYEINLYEPELIWYGERNYNIANGSEFKDYKLPLIYFWEQELKYVGYKYLPYILKKYSSIENMDLNNLVDIFIWDNHTVYNNIIQAPVLEKNSAKMFSYIHTEGAHIPFQYDKDLNIIEKGTYEQKIESSITTVNAYIQRLKDNGAYDNTVIVIMADHGNSALNSAEDMLERANPMLLIKGIDEHHQFAESQKPVSYVDLMDIFSNLLNGKSSEDSLSFIPDKRERIYIWYRNFQFENHMEEYVVTDKAWEWKKFKKTGKVYDLK